CYIFCFHRSASLDIYTLSLHDALPIFVVSLKYLAIVINLPSMGTWASMTLFFDFMRLREAALLFMPRGAMILFSINSSQLIPEALFNTSPATIYNRLS